MFNTVGLLYNLCIYSLFTYLKTTINCILFYLLTFKSILINYHLFIIVLTLLTNFCDLLLYYIHVFVCKLLQYLLLIFLYFVYL